MKLTLNTKINNLSSIPSKQKKGLEKLGIPTIKDLLFHFPFRYEDFSSNLPICNLTKDQTATIEGTVTNVSSFRSPRKKMNITECTISDSTGNIRVVWFNQPFIGKSLSKGKVVRISGKVRMDRQGLFFSSPSWENASRTPTNTAGLIPVYPETEGVTSKWIRWQIRKYLTLFSKVEDPIPQKFLKDLNLPSLYKSLKFIHFPESPGEYLLAQKRFAFQEMLILQISSLKLKQQWNLEKSVSISFGVKEFEAFSKSLPFSLTSAQQKACKEIIRDITKKTPMNRLLNGDVGSGKTVVAATASLAAVKAKYQSVIMAPTEVLARQHFESIGSLLAKENVKVALLTSSYKLISSNLKSKGSNFTEVSRKEIVELIRSGKVDLIIGTHALIQKDIRFKNLALIIVDEQHRFGVSQRAFLQQKASEINDGLKNLTPHFLTMTATPIPRTLSLAFFGNLDLSVLDEMPKNRKPILTRIVDSHRRNEMYDFVNDQIQKGHQAYIIFPLVEESKSLTQLKAATEEHKKLEEEIFPNRNIGLLHGKMKSKEKEQVMEAFKNKEYDILSATSVVEVGIDVPNATVIIIEDADRFGLSQLHQFRGRVGRSELQSYCFLITNNRSEKSMQRMKALVESTNGFKIAERDLELRGPGEFFGNKQSGIPDIAMENMANVRLIEISRKYAQRIIDEDSSLSKYPLIEKEIAEFQAKIHLE